MDISKKREQEQALIAEMIALYCKRNHKTAELCPDCDALQAYAMQRINKCPYMETKTFCANCSNHCYKPDMRDKIRVVMRYAGPRIIFRHPVLVLKHAFYNRRKTNEATTI